MTPETNSPWWRDAVIYQVYIRSFADGDGDGIGDLAGIRSRLPYLTELGVDALWITPFYPSPMADGGYDVADYRDIEPIFGTLADADALLQEAHELGLRVVLDIVPNHTSYQHEWFQAALAAGPGSPERTRYIFRPGKGPDGERPPTDWQSVFGGPAWTRLPDGEWYLHLFAPEQPDLNWEHPEVVEEFESILRFWLDRGVDGFRIDVAHGLKKDQEFPDLGHESEELLAVFDIVDHPFTDRDAVHEVFRGWRKVFDEYDGDRMLCAEAWVPSVGRLALYVRAGQLHTAFNFEFLKCPWDAERMKDVIDRSVREISAVGAPTTWVLSNHDVIRHATRYANLEDSEGHAGGNAWEGEPALDPERGLARARAGTLLMLALPGSAYVYQGEELGLPEVLDLPDDVLQDPIWKRSGHTERGRDGCRVPLPWTREGSSFGFGPDGSWLPQPPGWGELSVEAERGVPGSTWEMYREALRVRHEEPALGDGAMRWLDSPADTLVLARDPGFVCAVNLGGTPVQIPEYGEVLLASGPLDAPGVLPAETAVWFRTSGPVGG